MPSLQRACENNILNDLIINVVFDVLSSDQDAVGRQYIGTFEAFPCTGPQGVGVHFISEFFIVDNRYGYSAL